MLGHLLLVTHFLLPQFMFPTKIPTNEPLVQTVRSDGQLQTQDLVASRPLSTSLKTFRVCKEQWLKKVEKLRKTCNEPK